MGFRDFFEVHLRSHNFTLLPGDTLFCLAGCASSEACKDAVLFLGAVWYCLLGLLGLGEKPGFFSDSRQVAAMVKVDF